MTQKAMSTRRQRPYPNVSEGDRAMVPLEHDRAAGFFLVPPVVSCRIRDLLVFMNGLAVERDLFKACVRDLLPGCVKLRRSEDDIESLPFTGRLGGIDLRRITFVNVMITREELRAGINTSRMTGGRLLHTVAVRDLDLVN